MVQKDARLPHQQLHMAPTHPQQANSKLYMGYPNRQPKTIRVRAEVGCIVGYDEKPAMTSRADHKGECEIQRGTLVGYQSG